MRALCINKNGWYYHKGNYFGFLLAGKQSEIDGPQFNHEYEILSSFVDQLGSLCHIVSGYGDYGWEAECFIMSETELEEELLANQQLITNERQTTPITHQKPAHRLVDLPLPITGGNY